MNGPEPTTVEVVRRTDSTAVITNIGFGFSNAWFIMLALGGIHSEYAAVPAPSYWTTFLALIVLSLVSAEVRPAHRVWNSKKRGQS